MPLQHPGGAGRDRTGDLLNANQALSQLSYSPSARNLSASAIKSIEASWMQGSTRPAPRPLQSNSRNSKWRSGADSLPSPKLGQRLWSGTAISYSPAPYTAARGLSETPPTFSLRKEVIQPQVLLRLPCYDFTPIMDHTLGRCLPCGSACRLLVQSTFVM